MVGLTFAVLAARVDDRCNIHDRNVLTYVAELGDDAIDARAVTLDGLCERFPLTPRPHVFAAVARLEDLDYLPKGAIR